MDRFNVSRRALLFAGAGLALGGATPTASQIIERIKQNVGVPWRTETVDRIVAGDGAAPVKGIATTMMATLDVLQRAAAAGKNLVITHEPTFWLHQDTVQGLEQDPTYRYKAEFIRKNNMIVFRFHDHWHAHKPDGIATGMARELGWEKNTDAQNPRMFSFPSVTLQRFAQEIQSRLKIRTMRVVGDPDLKVSRVAASWGYASRDPGIQLLARPDVDVVIVGEAREWEVVEYAQDAISAGQKKALIVMGHVVSEQAGMKYCAEWLKTFISDVTVEFVAAIEPFWNPAA
jgi:putative NIF3 family GTP cyclohydrolase 1 type 2